MRKAVVDVGSNSVLLSVGERSGASWDPVFESSEVTALGQGTKETGLLGEQGMEETLAALARAFKAAREHGAVQIVAAATMAARIASNTDAFLARAALQGTPVHVLSGDDEARLGFLSVANDAAFREEPRIAIVDVGGHSTELAVAEREAGHPSRWRQLFRRSFPIGTLGLIGGVLSAECPGSDAILQASRQIDDQVRDPALPSQPGTAVALGATGTNLVSIREGLSAWNPARVHGVTLRFDEISLAAARLFSTPLAERVRLVGIETGREATLPSGALILERCLFALHADACRVSVRGWRHAMLEEI